MRPEHAVPTDPPNETNRRTILARDVKSRLKIRFGMEKSKEQLRA